MNTDAISELRYCSIVLPDMVGKPIVQVYEHLRKTYGEDKLAKIPEDLSTLPDEFKDGGWLYFFGSVLFRGGEAGVSSAFWFDGKWHRYGDWLGNHWDSPNKHVLLIED